MAELVNVNAEDYLRYLFKKVLYAKRDEGFIKLLPWNIEITPFTLRGEWENKEEALKMLPILSQL